MKSRILAILIALVPSLALSAKSLMVSLPGTLDDLVKDYYQPTVTAAFGTFTYGYSDLPSPFSRWLEDELGTAISKREARALQWFRGGGDGPELQVRIRRFLHENRSRCTPCRTLRLGGDAERFISN